MAEAQDVEALKRRGRRRLVGAVALVLAAVIVLPMVFDPEPRPAAPAVSVRIPGEGEAPFNPKPPPVKPAPPPVAPKPVVEKPKPPAIEYVFQVGVFANPEKVTAQLKTAKVPYTTETVNKLTRVRAGPFASKDAADKAHAQMKKLGIEPGAVTSKSG
jgi:DedD protein